MGTGTNGSGAASRDTGRPLVHQISRVFDYTTTTAAQISPVAIPAGSLVIGAGVYVATAFDDTGYAVVDIGTEANPDLFAVDLDVSAVGRKMSQALDSAAGLYFEDATTCVVTYIGENSDATAGSGYVFIEYISRIG